MQTKSESTNDRLQPSSLPITVAGVTKSYGALQVLSDINLHIKSGEFLTLLGPSGSGKTTLLMTLAGFIRPDLGSLKFGEEEVVLKAPHLRRVGMMFQNYALFPHMSVEANIGYPLKIRGEDRATIKSKFKAYLKRSGGWLRTQKDFRTLGRPTATDCSRSGDRLQTENPPHGRAAICARQEPQENHAIGVAQHA